jgi:hypothetical protein
MKTVRRPCKGVAQSGLKTLVCSAFCLLLASACIAFTSLVESNVHEYWLQNDASSDFVYTFGALFNIPVTVIALSSGLLGFFKFPFWLLDLLVSPLKPKAEDSEASWRDLVSVLPLLCAGLFSIVALFILWSSIDARLCTKRPNFAATPERNLYFEREVSNGINAVYPDYQLTPADQHVLKAVSQEAAKEYP